MDARMLYIEYCLDVIQFDKPFYSIPKLLSDISNVEFSSMYSCYTVHDNILPLHIPPIKNMIKYKEKQTLNCCFLPIWALSPNMDSVGFVISAENSLTGQKSVTSKSWT